MKKLIPYIIIAILVFILIKECTKNPEQKIIERQIKLTTKQIDSLKSTLKPLTKEVVVYKEKYAKIKEKDRTINYDTIVCKEIVENLKEQIKTCDSIVKNQDKIIVIKDSIQIKYEKIIEFKDVLIDKKQKKFGIGIQSGLDHKGKPYLGVGISYNLFGF